MLLSGARHLTCIGNAVRTISQSDVSRERMNVLRGLRYPFLEKAAAATTTPPSSDAIRRMNMVAPRTAASPEGLSPAMKSAPRLPPAPATA